MLALAIAGAIPRPALAVSGLYTMIGLGYGKFNGDDLVVEESGAGNDLPLAPGAEGCCAQGGLAAQFRLGYSLFGFAGEFGIIAQGWDLGGDTGGGGIVGGGLRFYPLDILKLGGVDLEEFPLDFGLGVLFGFAQVGKEFSYQGVGIDLDFQVDYKMTSFMSIGAKIDLGLPTFEDFVYTDFKNDEGRCLDGGGHQIVDGANFGKGQKGTLVCNGAGPSATLMSPQLVFTFHFDVID